MLYLSNLVLKISNIKLEINNEVQELKSQIKSWQQATQQNISNQSYTEVTAWLT
jgi:hypothetical protein